MTVMKGGLSIGDEDYLSPLFIFMLALMSLGCELYVPQMKAAIHPTIVHPKNRFSTSIDREFVCFLT